jgi:hypothetical protein
MARTHGSKTKPLPPSLIIGLTDLGYVEMPFTEYSLPVFRHPHHPHLIVVAAAPNIPGATEVVARWFGVPSKYINVDALLAELKAQISGVSPSQRTANRTAISAGLKHTGGVST